MASISKFFIVSLLTLVASCNAADKQPEYPTCRIFADEVVAVSVGQLRSVWTCYQGHIVVVQGYLSKKYSGIHTLYESLDAYKYHDLGSLIHVYLSDEELSKYALELNDGQLVHVQISAKLEYPFALGNVSRVVVHKVITPVDD